jgi:hypothetical protein
MSTTTTATSTTETPISTVSRKRGGRTRPAKGQARTRIYKWKLCTGDTHLQYFTQFRRLANTFEESIWAYTVMHPSVMHEDTLRQSLVCDRSLPCPPLPSLSNLDSALCSRQHNSDETGANPLLFNVNILVALGTYTLCDQ